MPIARLILLSFVVLASSLWLGCGKGGSGSSTNAICGTGELRCPCYPNDTCNGGLTCVSQVCVQLAGPDGAAPDVGSAVPTGGNTTGPGSTSDTTPCASGDAGCLCFGNGTCNGNLVCLVNICVVPSAVGGATAVGGVVTTVGGAIASGGMTPAGGATVSATGGTTGTGGQAGGTTATAGGTTATAGGTTTVGSAGAIGTGGGTIPAGGTTTVSNGGTIGTGGGTVPVGGTTTIGGGGTMGTGGAGNTGTANQVCPDATHCYLGLEGNRAPLAGNSFGIDGTFYLVGDDCATFTWDAQTRCASGTMCAKDPPSYSHWGVEIALNLRTGGGYDYPYDATAHGVTGFFWELTGTAPGMQVWIPLATKSGACLQTDGCALSQPPWGNRIPGMGPTGENYVEFEGSMSYDDWGSAYEYPPPWDPTRLHSITWKLPARASATTFSFCVQKVGVIHD